MTKENQTGWSEDWIEVFKTGEHTDSAGNTKTWTKKDLDAIAKKYNPQNHEAPIVIGHPKDNHPAYGWVENVKREGSKLKVKLKKVLPEFKNWVEKGLYRKISVALSNDIGLRHIGFLGAAAPAIKGLKHAFNEKHLDSIDSKNIYIKQNFNKGANMKPNSIETFNEQIQKKEQQIEILLKEQEKQEFAQFSQKLHTEGKIPTGYKQIVTDVLHSISRSEGYFSDTNHQNETLNNFKHFLSNLPDICEFTELATRENIAAGTMRLPEEDLGVRMANSLKK